MREDPQLWRQLEAMVREAAAVARCRGVDLAPGIEADRLQLARNLPPEMRSSMLQDLEAGRRLELDWLTGAVVRLGAEAGVATPVSTEVYNALAPLKDGAAAETPGCRKPMRRVRSCCSGSSVMLGFVRDARSPWVRP